MKKEYDEIKNLVKEFNICKETIYRHSKKGNISFKYKNKRTKLYSRKDVKILLDKNIIKPAVNMDTNLFKQKAKEKLGKDYLVIGNYVNDKTKIKMKHLTCGRTYYANTSNVIHNGNGCPYCFGTKRKDIKEYSKYIKEKTNNEFNVISKEYKNNKTKITYIHNKCKRTFDMRPNDFDKRLSCPLCRESKGERKIEKFLDKNNIFYKKQYKYDKFKIDFCIYMDDNSLLFIEYDGIQHFKPYFKCNKMEGEKQLELQIERDILKEKLISKEENISLIRISYSNYDKLETILSEILINLEFNDYPIGEYSKIRGNLNYPNIIYIG